MLIELTIENLAIIENIHLKFGQGMTVLSGEEGSGKSLIVDALGILLGTRATAKLIRNGRNHARIEAVFCCSENISAIINEILKEIDLEPEDDGTIVVSRDIHQQGRSVSRINGHAIPQSYLQRIGNCLIDIHGQMDNISIFDIHHQLSLIDAYGNLAELKAENSRMIDEFRLKSRELNALDNFKSSGKIDLLKYQIEEIERANIKANEEEELQLKLDLLQNSNTLKDNCTKIYTNLYGEDRSVTVLLHETLAIFRTTKTLPALFEKQILELQGCISLIDDIAHELNTFSNDVELDTIELENIEQRLNLLNSLRRKYGPTLEDVIQYHHKSVRELHDIETSLEFKTNLLNTIDDIKSKAGRLSLELSNKRRDAAASLTGLVNLELQEVGLPLAKFSISIVQEESSDGLLAPCGKHFDFTRDGIDRIEYMICTNPGEPVRPLRTIASGGETSRIMLALKSALKKVDPIPTLVFDEIDAGVGARNGENIGRKLVALSRTHQVICITHLPQIACYADSHIKLTKELKSGRVLTTTETINGKNRIEELADMLGINSTDRIILKGAEKLLNNALDWKNGKNSKYMMTV